MLWRLLTASLMAVVVVTTGLWEEMLCFYLNYGLLEANLTLLDSSEAHCIVQASFKLVPSLLPQPSKCSTYKLEPPCPAQKLRLLFLLCPTPPLYS